MNKLRLITLIAALLPAALFAQDNPFDATPEQQKLIAKIPTDSAEEAREIFKQLAPDVDTLVPEFVDALSTEKNDTDTTARYALGGLVWTIGHSGSNDQKQQLAQLLADSIADADGTEPKVFLIEQLQYMGQDSVASTLYPLMTDEELGPRAIRTLAALKPNGLAEKALAALDDSNTTPVQTGLLLTVARLAPPSTANRAEGVRSAADAPFPKDAATQIAALANDDDPSIQKAALDALSSIGDPASREALKAAAIGTDGIEDHLAAARYLAYAKNLSGGTGVEICREIAAMDHTTATRYLVGLSLTTLTDIIGEKAADDLLAHVYDDAEDVRATALDNLNRFEGAQLTERIVEKMAKSPDAEVTIGILRGLGDRGNATALSDVAAKFDDDNAEIAATAVGAAGEIDRAGALPAFIDALKSDKDKAVVEAVVEQLRRVPSDLLLPAMASAIPEATVEGKIALIGLLGDRQAASQKEAIFTATKSDDAKVRSAAYDALGEVAEAGDLPRLRDMILAAEKNSDRKAARQAFVAAAKDAGNPAARSELLLESFESADLKGKTALLEAMAALADKETLDSVIEAASTKETPELQDAAVRALSEWQSPDAVPALERIADKSKNEKHQVLAVRGLARLADAESDIAKKTALLKTALNLAKRDEERKTIIAQLGDIHTTAALEVVSPYVDRKGIAAEAAAAAVKIAMPDENHKGIRGAETAETLGRALPAIPDLKPRNSIEKYIYGIIRDIELAPTKVNDDGFSILFNGKDLSGWCGDTEGYSVEDGILVCQKDGGGKLYTEKQYGDFVMRFDFKLQAGGNNGVAIRAPLHGNPAYLGMEIQILDGKDPQYKDIKPWQNHGAVYGVSTPEPADLKIGEWNTEEISVVGRNVKVTVNGKVITDVNLDEATKDGILSDKAHPGLDRNRGHIGFLGHHHRIEFRNIRLKNIANNDAPKDFTALFNGENLDGWKGLVTDPIKRAKASDQELKEAQAKADASMHEHWKVNNGILFFDGEGSHLCTTKDYRNFEMLVDWCIPPGGDNGLYLRGSPQVQIWDPRYWPQGSGGLYNNKEHTSDPLTLADNPIGQWNTFRIKMVDNKVTVHLNDELVVDNEILENYWDRELPIFSKGQIELQSHGSPAWWRNIYLRELPE